MGYVKYIGTALPYYTSVEANGVTEAISVSALGEVLHLDDALSTQLLSQDANWVAASGFQPTAELAAFLGASPMTPRPLAAVKAAFINYDTSTKDLGNTYTYNNGPANNGIGATITAGSNGAMSADGYTPSVGDSIVVSDGYAHGNGSPPHPDGVYVVTQVGSASTPWILTRRSDCDSAAELGTYWAVAIQEGTLFGQGAAVVWGLDAGGGPGAFVPGTSFLQLAINGSNSVALGTRATASGSNSAALGSQCDAQGANSVAVGNTCVASAQASWAGGYTSNATNQEAIALGISCYATALQASAFGVSSAANSENQIAKASGNLSQHGDAQSTEMWVYGQTTTATQATLASNLGKKLTFRNYQGSNDYNKTIHVKVTVCARRIDVYGTDSVWVLEGVLRGNGSNAYSWVGGSAPTATLIAQDAGASAWAPVLVSSTNQLLVEVTGAAGETINWVAHIECDEIKG